MATRYATAVWLLFLCLLITTSLQGAPSPLHPQADPRVAKKYTLYHPPTPLSELLQALSRQTGVTLRVERSIAQHRAVHASPLAYANVQLRDDARRPPDGV